jgi:hypothetical protein
MAITRYSQTSSTLPSSHSAPILPIGSHAPPSKCDVLSTLPSLQYDFCALWNEIALEAQNGKDPIPTLILENIRPVYIALHTGTDASPKAFSATAT